MGERSSSLFARLTLRSKRRGSSATSATAPTSSSTSTRSASSPVTTPEAETPSSFSGLADYGLGYSSINHERSPSYKAKRTSKAALSRPIEFDRYAEPSLTQRDGVLRTRSLPRRSVHPEEEPLFVEIVHEAAPTSPIQSTVRARSRTSTTPPDHAAGRMDRPQSPFAINSAASHSSFGGSEPPKRISPRRCHSVNSPHIVHRTPSIYGSLAPTAASSPPYHAVARGWKKGIYASKEDAERQILNFPGPLMQVFDDRKAAESSLADSARLTPQSRSQAEYEDEFIERTRIFKGLDPNSDLARRRTMSIVTERNEAKRRSRILRATATQSPVFRYDGPFTAAATVVLTGSPTLSHSDLVFPIEETKGCTDSTTSPPLPSMALLPVKHLSNSMTFYAMVLGFNCISHTADAQAVMSSPAATLCLRTAYQAPPSANGANLSRTNSNGAPKEASLVHGRPALPTMSEELPNEANLALPPTPDSLSLSCPDPESIKLSPTSIPLRSRTWSLSGITVLVEHSGALEALRSHLTARLNEWRLECTKAAQFDCAKILGDVHQTPWGAQELHVSDLDGHRIIYTTPLPRGSPALVSI